jgi:hypothetical protein
MIRSKPKNFLHAHVRHIAVAGALSPTDAVEILSKCSGVVRLGIFQMLLSPAFLPSLASMHLQRLAADLGSLFDGGGVDFGHVLFARLTHLDILDLVLANEWPSGFGRIPCLTHISFSSPAEPAFFQNVLAHCWRLEVLVAISESSGTNSLQEFFAGCVHLCEDVRAVLMLDDDFLDDWEIGVEGGADYWKRAARFIEKRRTGEVKGELHSMPPEPNTDVLASLRVCSASGPGPCPCTVGGRADGFG